jgi:hypothetical protein
LIDAYRWLGVADWVSGFGFGFFRDLSSVASFLVLVFVFKMKIIFDFEFWVRFWFWVLFWFEGKVKPKPKTRIWEKSGDKSENKIETKGMIY